MGGLPTARSVVLGCLMCGLIGVAGPYLSIWLQSSRMFADYHTAGATFLLFALLLVFNFGLGRLWRPLALRGEELRFITAMMLVSGSIVTSGLLAHWVPQITAVHYDANASNRWGELLLPHLPGWLSPLDPDGGTQAIQKFWEGLREGEPIPWGPWVKPLALWGLFFLALFTCMTAVMTIMRKQWVDHEHLSFPIAQVPGELCAAADDPGHPASILRSRAFWVGVGLTFLLASTGGLGHYFGVFSPFRIRHTITDFGPIPLRMNVELVVVGLVFLIPNRIAFSVWFLALVSWAARSFMRTYGFGMSDWMLYGGAQAHMQHMSMGAMIVLVLSSIWVARHHLRRVLRCAFGRGDDGYDDGEPARYLTSLILAVLCGAAVVVWLGFVGLKPHYGIVLLLAFLVVFYGMARVVAQVGLPSVSAPVLPSTWVATTFGPSQLGAQQVTTLGAHIINADMRNSAMSGAAHGMYLTRRRGGLVWAMVLSLAITFAVGCICTVWISYRHGASNMDHWFFINSPRGPWRWAAGTVAQARGPAFQGMAWAGAGALVMAGLTLAQRMFFWWPIHPVAFLVCSTHMVLNLWLSVFLAWLAKLCIVGFGGYGAYRAARRLFIGMVMGYFLAGGTWNIVDIMTRSVGDQVFYL